MMTLLLFLLLIVLLLVNMHVLWRLYRISQAWESEDEGFEEGWQSDGESTEPPTQQRSGVRGLLRRATPAPSITPSKGSPLDDQPADVIAQTAAAMAARQRELENYVDRGMSDLQRFLSKNEPENPDESTDA